MKTLARLIGLFALVSLLAACGGGGNGASFTGGTGGTPTPTPVPGPTAKSISLGTTQSSVKSDNSNSATLTATVLDSNNAVLAGVPVSFSTTAGQLSTANGTTDANGRVTVSFSSGTTDPSNGTATITATASGLKAQLPIQITGSTLTLSAGTTSLVIGGSSGQEKTLLTVTAKNAAGVAVNGAAISLSIGSATDTGTAVVQSATGTTNGSGVFTTDLTATNVGSVTVTATWTSTSGTQTTTAIQAFTVTGTGTAFYISTPTTNPTTVTTDNSQVITVTAPGVSNVTFVTSLGKFDGTAALVTKPVNGSNQASATLTSTESGVASVQVFDAANNSTQSTTKVIWSAPCSAADHVVLQSSSGTLAPSTGGTSNTSALTATVYTSAATNNQPVSGCAVTFSLSNTTGGGENVSPVYGVSDASGVVNTTFTSGTKSTGAGGVTITATGYKSGTAITQTDGANVTSITINQTAASVVIGAATTAQDANNTTSYILPVTVLVSDSGGHPVANALVTLSAWPDTYSTGYWTGTTNCIASVTANFANEDINENVQLDPGEDIPYSISGSRNYASTATVISGKTYYSEDLDGSGTLTNPSDPGGASSTTFEDLNGNGLIDQFTTDGILTPANTAAGTLPGSVTTDANGAATVNLTYLKRYATWITDRIRATTMVLGTETTSVMYLRLPVTKPDADACLVYDSPYNPKIYP